MQKTIGKTTLRLVTGDIAEQDTDAVVTAAHWRLNQGMFEAIRQLMTPPEQPRKEIGFHINEASVPYRIRKQAKA